MRCDMGLSIRATLLDMRTAIIKRSEDEHMNMHSSVEARRFLFALWEGGGNVPPQLELARRLVQRGHRVRIMSDQCNEPEARAAGCEFVAYTRAPSRRDKSAASTIVRDYEAKTPIQGFTIFRDTIMVNPARAYAEDVFAELDRESADMVVVSDFLFGPMIAAEKARIPYAILVPNPYMLPAPGLPPAGTPFAPPRNILERARDGMIKWIAMRTLNGGLPGLNMARTALGLAPVAHILEFNQHAARVLMLTSPAFDFTPTRLPDNVRYVGPMLNDPSWTTDAPSDIATDSAPLVVVSFSTTFQNQATILQKVLDALGELPIRAIATIGPALDSAQFRVPTNVTLRPSARHSELFGQAAAVVTHGGHGTVIRALAAGVPLICIPMGRDQQGNAARVVARHAGKLLSEKASVAVIRAAIHEVAIVPCYREGAQLLAKSIVGDAQSSSAVAELESVANG